MNKIPSVIVFSDLIHSGCSFWRSQGVYLELAREGHINMLEGNWDNTWTTLRGADIAVFQRPMSIDIKNQVFMAKDCGLKVIIDLDDYNHIHPSHPVYSEWCKKYNEKTFQKIMMLADVVTVTTKPLQDYYLTYNNNVKIIPNALNDYWLPFRKLSTNSVIILRAGDHHLSDIWKYKEEIKQVMSENKEWELHVLGCEIDFLKDISGYKFIGDFNIHDYFAYILRTNPSIFIVPLEDNELNRCKSNISWLESTLAGSASLTPHWWKLNNCSLTYKDGKSFALNMNRLIKEPELRKELYNKSYQKVQSEYLLSKVNNKRIEVIKNLIK
jgi:hypothetical protein